MVLGTVCAYFSNPNILLYDFITYHMNFIQKEHVKLDETCIDARGRLKANLPNVMNVVGHLTSKLNKT